jgi:oxygen-dependent protoporphyrinogen oxidase
MRVLVVGGGITGLTAAYTLARAGIPTTLVEASGRLGGKLRTERIDGFLVEAGPDSFVSYRPAAIELAHELGLRDAIVRPREPRVVQIRTGGRFVPLPQEMGLVLPTRLRPFVTTPLFAPHEKLRMGLDLVLPRDDLTRDVGVGAHLRRRLGAALVDRLAGPLLGGVYGTSIDELSLLAVVPQLRDAERAHRSLLLASLAAGRARRHGDGSPFVTLAGGMGQLIDALVGALQHAADVEIHTQTALRALERRGADGSLEALLASGERLRPDAVILTTPGPEAARLIDGVAPRAATALRTIPHGTTAVVSLGYRTAQFSNPPANHGFVVAAGEPLSIDACTISSAKWPGRAPEGTVLVRAFIGSRSGRAPSLSDGALVAAAMRDVATTLGARGDPLLVRLARWTNQMPQYTVGHLDRVAAVFAGLAETPNLILAGAPYQGVGIPDGVAQGRAAAARTQELVGTTRAARPVVLAGS